MENASFNKNWKLLQIGILFENSLTADFTAPF